MFHQSFHSLNIKITTIFILLGLFLLTILFVQVIPKMQKEQKEHTKQQIENMIYLTTQQLKLATKALQEQGYNKREYKKSIIESKVDTLLTNVESKEALAKELGCDIFEFDSNHKVLFQTNDTVPDISLLQQNNWTFIQDSSKQTMCPNPPKQIFYSKQIKGNETLVVSCKPSIFSDKSVKFENNLKQDIQKSFELLNKMHKGKIYLMWINKSFAKNSDQSLYNINDHHYYNNKYCISKTSNLQFPKTGTLRGQQLLDAINKDPISHMLDDDKDKGNYIYPAYTWVRLLKDDEKRPLLFITTILAKDIDTHLDSAFWKILPASLIALLLAIILGFILFKRIFKTISILSHTAYKVNKGDLTVRSKIKQNDDIEILGKTFDKMLDSLEKNIQTLDKKVELRTKELQSSLEEKETLLKEIHHRVKNNLAMTIDLIKLQKIKLKDKATKEALTDIQERIYTMELLHRKLYESTNLSSIDFKKYVEELSEDLLLSYSSNKNITIKTDIIELFMDIEYALPCGLIINECLTNSLKHAFQKNENGKISISLQKEKHQIILKIADNGKGIDSNIDIYKTSTLGLKLITTIVKNQLLGTIEYEKKNYSSFIIQFTIEKTS